ncbi:MAG: FliM/FliN family flagellar motor switch protein [SAR324 cluster bacterium]|jgi:flagellar motor switch protein FliN/FliY|nr:FliM/FliN family flagellar motor switch protein [SAR324 cluster bacterium]MDP6743296.1 FliM/FliN family flagellar motor switch protein [SAR324 cluster bacterium]MDP7046687.1 FliM/FliN family flagellar motor switch protein [SAR324 cluster bacterium]MEC7888156.1 FliM/FliN family flagellar motor switch protein [SAR324 cluster bacterium]MEC8939516.1 FliM/FliN family flagellar motor switch protein [SAR324 cluster bacterium]
MSTETPEQESTLHKLKFLADASHVMQAEIARTDISLNEVMLWKKGTVVVLDKIVGSTIDVLIGDRLIARGEVVVINDRFGVRISEITHPDEKPKLGWKK